MKVFFDPMHKLAWNYALYPPLIETQQKDTSSVIRQQIESQKCGNKKTKDAEFSEKQTVCVAGGKKCSFYQNSERFVFLLPPFWDSPFCPINDDLENINLWISLELWR